MENFKNKIAPYKEKFFFGKVYEVIRIYDEDFGFFVVHKNPDNINEVFWAVNDLEDLKRGLELAKQDFSGFIFRYGKEFNQLMQDKEKIKPWGYRLSDIHVGFRLDLGKIAKIKPNINIELLTLAGIDEVMRLDYSMFDNFNASREELVEMVNSKSDQVFFAKEEGHAIGFIIINDIHDKQCFIRNLGVCETCRGKGIGYQLLMFALNQAKAKGSKSCFLWVGYNNKVAINLYKKAGFVQDFQEGEAVFSYFF